MSQMAMDPSIVTSLNNPAGTVERGTSRLCTEIEFCTEVYRNWCEKIVEPQILHRKVWEFYFICQSLAERGMLKPGKRGLGFAVGGEPLPATFASFGCEILGSDLATDDERAEQWIRTKQHAPSLEGLNRKGICDPQVFFERVSYRHIDMTKIPQDVQGYDFSWSACAFEHCGTLEAGIEFFIDQMRCLRPGGIAVHTTEFNLSSNEATIESGETVLYRRRDIEDLVQRLTEAGHTVEPIDWSPGFGPADKHVDCYPFSNIHLKLEIGGYACTSIGLIVHKAA